MDSASANPPMHFADWFRRHAITRPTRLAIATPGASLTYAEFYRATLSVARRLSELRVESGQTVALCIRNAALHCVLIVALNRMGCITLSRNWPERAGEDVDLPSSVPLDHVVVEQPFAGNAPPAALHVDLDWLKASGGAVADQQNWGFSSSDSVARIFTSSGTTGAIKAIGLSMRQIENRIFRRTVGAFAVGRTEKTLCQFGLGTSIGTVCVFSTFWSGGTVFLGWPESAVPGQIATHSMARIEASTAQYQSIVRHAAASSTDLSALRLALTSGSTTPGPLIAAIRSKICRAFVGVYGSTEMGVISYGPMRETSEPGFAGHLASWTLGQVVDERDKPLPAGEDGIVRFRSEDMVTSYIDDPEASAECFRDGWFYPGDTGKLSEDSALTITGRISERINAGGVKVSPDFIDNVVAAFDGIAECAAFSVPDRMGVEEVWCAIVVNREIDQAELHAFCAAKLGPRAPRQFLTLNELPRNDAGKILRGALPKLATGSPNALAAQRGNG